MADEYEIAFGVLQIASARSDGICTFDQAYRDIPNYVHLDANNLSPSITRPGEPMWYQIVRNIKSHDKTPGNFIYLGYLGSVPGVGYRITDSGHAYLKKH